MHEAGSFDERKCAGVDERRDSKNYRHCEYQNGVTPVIRMERHRLSLAHNTKEPASGFGELAKGLRFTVE